MIDQTTVFVGPRRRLDGFGKSAGTWPQGHVYVSYKDEDGNSRQANLCVEGARQMALALKQSADFLDPPKPRRKRKTT